MEVVGFRSGVGEKVVCLTGLQVDNKRMDFVQFRIELPNVISGLRRE